MSLPIAEHGNRPLVKERTQSSNAEDVLLGALFEYNASMNLSIIREGEVLLKRFLHVNNLSYV